MFAVLSVSVVAALSAAFLRVQASITAAQMQEVETTRAFNLAEAGLAEAYHALRIGLTGQIGSIEAPAAYGQGLIWVDAEEIGDGTVRLESTGMCGRGRATLALLVEPVELPLGIFSDEDLTIDDVVLVDGYDSEEASYGETVLEYEQASAGEYSDKIAKLEEERAALQLQLDHARLNLGGAESSSPDIVLGTGWGTGVAPDDSYNGSLAPNSDIAYNIDSIAQLEAQIATLDAQIAQYVDLGSQSVEGLSETALSALQEEATAGTIDHTFDGALVGSNGTVTLSGSGSDAPEIFGDVIPGPGADVATSGDALVTGETEARGQAVDLPPVEVPEVDMLPAAVQASPIPMVVSPGSVGYASMTVAADAELIVRGPCNLVLGSLTLEPGADLFLDTTDGDVALFVTGPVDLRAGSNVMTSGASPDELSLQVADAVSTDGTPPVKLDATASFYGTIYSPNSGVRVGADFEVFGGLVAQALELAPGTRLHFDGAGFDGPGLPRFLSWEIVEIPAAVRGGRGDAFEVLGVDPAECKPLCDSHELEGITLYLKYYDQSDVLRSYEGLEVDFDWDYVAEVVSTERVKPEDQQGDQGEQGEQTATGIRPTISDILSAGYSKSILTSKLIYLSPLSAEELLAAKPILGPAHYNQVKDAQ